MEQPPGNGNGNKNPQSLQALKDLNWPTVILIMLSGGTNFFATQKNSTDREYQVQQALSQIRDLHNALDDFEKRQKQGLEQQTQILERDTTLLKNVNQILEHDTQLLSNVHDIASKFDNWKRAEQMRGAPP
jgi:TolA-binding protein